MILLRLALQSLRARALTVLLCIGSLALSVALILSVERLRDSAWGSFSGAVSGVDLIVGARSGSTELLLYSVFRLGSATQNFTWRSYQDIAAHSAVDWIVPMSLGDSHRGFRVIGTTDAYLERIRVHDDRPLAMADGVWFDDLFDVVLGADVAARLDYETGDQIVIAHGVGAVAVQSHDDMPFRVSGVLARTGTPIDRSLYFSLEAMEAIHVDWRGGFRAPGPRTSPEAVREMNLEPQAVTAAMIGLKSRAGAFALQRYISGYTEEPLGAILPGAALRALWRIVGAAEQALAAVSALVAAAALLGMATMLLATLNERRREMAILRTVGARPISVFGLLMAEAGLIAAAGVVVGALVHIGVLTTIAGWLETRYGLYMQLTGPTLEQAVTLGLIALAALLCALPPAVRAYRMSLAAGMQVRT